MFNTKDSLTKDAAASYAYTQNVWAITRAKKKQIAAISQQNAAKIQQIAAKWQHFPFQPFCTRKANCWIFAAFCFLLFLHAKSKLLTLSECVYFLRVNNRCDRIVYLVKFCEVVLFYDGLALFFTPTKLDFCCFLIDILFLMVLS